MPSKTNTETRLYDASDNKINK